MFHSLKLRACPILPAQGLLHPPTDTSCPFPRNQPLLSPWRWARKAQKQSLHSSRSVHTMLSGIQWDCWGVLCRTRSWTGYLWVASSSGYSTNLFRFHGGSVGPRWEQDPSTGKGPFPMARPLLCRRLRQHQPGLGGRGDARRKLAAPGPTVGSSTVASIPSPAGQGLHGAGT